MNKPKILTLDIETAPITAYTWGLFKQNIGLNQIKADWHLIAFAAKWMDKKKTMYLDNRHNKDITDDRRLLIALSGLLNEADIVVTQNGEAFDLKKINARAVINGLPPIKPVASTDILKEGRKVFSFTSHKLEYVADKVNKKYKKLKHSKYPGFDLWAAVLKNDQKAWKEMEIYTIHDVLSTEEIYKTIQGWIATQAISSFNDSSRMQCRCGNTRLEKRGYAYTPAGKYQIYHCLRKSCGKWPRSPMNLLSKEKRQGTLREYRGGRD